MLVYALLSTFAVVCRLVSVINANSGNFETNMRCPSFVFAKICPVDFKSYLC
uniref:Uncharacterized protein n=1 Tax=Arundo donax TaxID=35708 RepID=A0A0A8ZK80_ARUDO